MTSNKLFTRLRVLLAKIKVGSNQYKLKIEIRQILHPAEHIVDNKLVTATETKKFCFGLPKDSGNNLEHENYSIIKHDKLLAEHKIKSEIRNLLSKYKHGHNTHEHGNLIFTKIRFKRPK